MTFEEMVVALVGAVGGIGLVAFIFAKIVGLIKTWINRNNTAITEEDFDNLAQAFMEYRSNSERRIRNLEAIVAGEETESQSLPHQAESVEQASKSIELEDNDERNSAADPGGSLRNMLNER
ncbi:hypothetical protein [Fodinibius sediminis]|uniref:Uncharacterized protein n=1 Tax=Fodinibius sediminis TaxID=1214077 RepID=A0A521ALZ5_9BACT|nr:hypothetical protein [Fodinibius sediminis]SMO35825.1 hypothetical protein SAMN06265218_101206 [Fodinibius sediminis]